MTSNDSPKGTTHPAEPSVRRREGADTEPGVTMITTATTRPRAVLLTTVLVAIVFVAVAAVPVTRTFLLSGVITPLVTALWNGLRWLVTLGGAL
ncbi:MAG TPA: hypothetical protein VH352_06830 [Pseudonocardiaceae bacterium]|jgi:hypothetical protein|nr:hypothetical protein [Pseudonocardiaceae bacterium]